MSEPSSTPDHWDGRYTTVGSSKVSWFQEKPEPSLRLVDSVHPSPDGVTVDIGGGTARLVDELVARGFSKLIVVDISRVALEEMQSRLAAAAAAADAPPPAVTPVTPVTPVVADIRAWKPDTPVNLWHDRAVYHFLTDPDDQRRYWDTVRAAVVPGGHVIIGTFAEDGPSKCSNLPVARYSQAQLVAAMGAGFQVEHAERHVHITPGGGEQAFTWVVARRV